MRVGPRPGLALERLLGAPAKQVFAQAVRTDHGRREQLADRRRGAALSARDEPAYGNEPWWDQWGSFERQREHEVAACLCPCALADHGRCLGVSGHEGGNLASDEGAIALVEVDDAVETVVARLSGIGGQQSLCEINAVVPCQVHRQERDVCADIAETKTFIELDAVDDRDRVILEIHMLQSQVSVAVTDSPRTPACLEARLVREHVELPRFDGASLRRAQILV